MTFSATNTHSFVNSYSDMTIFTENESIIDNKEPNCKEVMICYDYKSHFGCYDFDCRDLLRKECGIVEINGNKYDANVCDELLCEPLNITKTFRINEKSDPFYIYQNFSGKNDSYYMLKAKYNITHRENLLTDGYYTRKQLVKCLSKGSGLPFMIEERLQFLMFKNPIGEIALITHTENGINVSFVAKKPVIKFNMSSKKGLKIPVKLAIKKIFF